MLKRRKLANIRRALASGLPNQVAYRDQRVGPDAYRTLSLGYTVYIHPSSALYEELPDLVTYHETVKTSRYGISQSSICCFNLQVDTPVLQQGLVE